jgi:hypothetical protein
MVNVRVSFGVRLILFFHFLTQRAYRSYKQGPRSDFTIVGGGGGGGAGVKARPPQKILKLTMDLSPYN